MLRLVGAFLLLLSAAATAESAVGLDKLKQTIRARFPEVPQTSTRELRALLSDGARTRPVLLDVRTREEFAVSHLAGARRAESIDEALRALDARPLDVPVVAYCAVGYRSSALVRALRERGYENASNLEGSIFEWANEGNPVERDGRVVHEVHPYGWPWSRYLAPALRTRR